jgi:hypothetical protein
MMTLAFAGLSLVLYLLGMYAMNDWIPQIEQYSGRTLSSFTKAKYLVLWPWVVFLDMIADRIEMDR